MSLRDQVPENTSPQEFKDWAEAVSDAVIAVVQLPGQPLPSRPDARVVHWYSWDEPPSSISFPYDQWFEIPEVAATEGAPDAPTDISSTAGDAAVLVEWTASVSGGGFAPDGHRVYRNTSNDFGTATAVADVGPAATEYNDTGVDNNTEYWHWVTAFNTFGESDPDGPVSAIPAEPQAPEAFATGDWTVADTTTGGEVSLTVSQLPFSEETITAIEYRLDSGAAVSLGGDTVGTYPITGLTNDQQYAVQIRGVSVNGAGDWSDTKLVTPTEAVLEPPAALASGDWDVVDTEAGEQVELTILAVPVSNPEVTDIEYAIDQGTPISTGLTAPGSTFVSGLTNDVQVEFEVRAVNAEGPGAWSDAKQVTPTEVVATMQSQAFTDTGSFEWDWNAAGQPSVVDVLVVAGGGGGGATGGAAGGGGAGGVIFETGFAVSGNVSGSVGGGGLGAGTSENGQNGQDSVFGSLTAIGGGGGEGSNSAGGSDGGSGGGGGNIGGGAGQGTAGQGFDGGTGAVTGTNPSQRGGGGGGASEAGENAVVGGIAGRGGDGIDLTAEPVFNDYGVPLGRYGGGGGGAFRTGNNDGTAGFAGSGLGGDAATSSSGANSTERNALPNTGGGGGSDDGGNAGRNGGNGGSGIVVVRWIA